jgi:hypothetical protein
MHLLAFVLALATVGHVQAERYRYAYEFSSGHHITGFVDGVADGDLLASLSNISLYYDGVGFANNGHLLNWGGPGLSMVPGTAVMSFSGTANLFSFSSSDIYTGTDLQQFTIGALGEYTTAFLFSANPVWYVYEIFEPARWHVSAVPEPGSHILLLIGLAGLGFAMRKRWIVPDSA